MQSVLRHYITLGLGLTLMATAIGIAAWLRFELPAAPDANWWETPDLLSDPRGVAAWIAAIAGTVLTSIAGTTLARRRTSR